MCLTSTANIGRALTAAVAKASVYQCAGKPFADPKACVGPLAADLVEYLAGDVGGGDPGEGAAGALSDLHSAMEAWTTSKKSWLGSVGETFSKASQADAIDALKSAVFKGEGWKVSDRERVSRELLLRVRHASCPNGSGVSRTAGFSVLLTRSVPSHFLLQYDRGKLAHCEEAFETADALYEHKLACAFRPVQCPNEGCAEVFGANAAGGHDALCAFKVLECPRGCGEGVTRRELEAHVTSTCAKRRLSVRSRRSGVTSRRSRGRSRRTASSVRPRISSWSRNGCLVSTRQRETGMRNSRLWRDPSRCSSRG